MAKRKSFIELQNKPQNSEVRKLIEKPKTVEYAPLNSPIGAAKSEDNQSKESLHSDDFKNQKPVSNKARSSADENLEVESRTKNKSSAVQTGEQSGSLSRNGPEKKSVSEKAATVPKKSEQPARQERLRIFQTSSPHTRAVTQYHKAAIVVRSESGRQTVELAWRDQMNEKTRDIWNYLVKRFEEAAALEIDEILIRKRDVLENSGVKSDRTFISAIYTLEDMELIRVRRLSGNKEGNVYILTDEGRQEIESYKQAER